MKRPITAKQRAWLLDQLSIWRRDAIVSDQQAQRITDLYEGAGEMAERGRSRAVSVLMAAAATLVGLAAMLLVGYNWDQLSRESKTRHRPRHYRPHPCRWLLPSI